LRFQSLVLALLTGIASASSAEDLSKEDANTTAQAPATEQQAPAAEQATAAEPAPAAEPEKADAVPVTELPPKNDQTPDDEGDVLPEVIVTANKRRQSLRDIPGSIAAVGGEQLENIKAQGLSDYIKLVPGVVLIDRGSDTGSPIIRGIATNTTMVGGQFTQAPVGIYIDDTPFSDLFVPFTQPDINPFDLERVEILKGPQGTLFGAGALAGGIRYVLKKPTLDGFEAKGTVTAFANEFSEGLSPVYGAAVNSPAFFDNTVAFRIVGLTREESGTFDEIRVGKKDVDKLKQDTARILGRWDVSEQFKLNGMFFFQQTDRVNAPFADNPRTFERSNQVVLNQTSGFNGANLSAGYESDWFSVLSSSNYLTKDAVNFVQGAAGIANFITGDPDGDGGDNGPGTEEAGLDVIRNQLNSKTKGFFQEIRLASPEGRDFQPWDWLRVQWLLGGAIQRTNQTLSQRQDVIAVQDNVNPVIGAVPGLPVGPGVSDRDTTVISVELDSTASETSIFGETTVRLWKFVELTVGARLFKTKLRADGDVAGAQAFLLDQSDSVPIHTGVDAEGINPRYSLRGIFNDNVQVYALAAKGFQFGGVQLNPPARALTTFSQGGFVPYDSSKLWNYELGLRTEFFDRKLRWDTTLFYLDWKDLQITILTEAAPGGSCCGLTFGLTQNIGAAKSQGLETALTLSPIRGLTMSSSASWVDARITEDFQSSVGLIRKGTRLPASPRFQMANVVSYSTPIAFLGAVQSTLSLTHTHIGSSFNDLLYTRPLGGYDTFDASLNLLKSDWRFAPDLTLSMLNLADTRGVAAVDASTGGRDVGYYFIRPRSMLLSLAARF